jgi:DNA-binding MarR family transcriptional regulator
LTRVRSRRDRRVVEVGITDKGLQILRGLDPHVNRYPKAMLGHLGRGKLEQLGALLDHVVTALGTFP